MLAVRMPACTVCRASFRARPAPAPWACRWRQSSSALPPNVPDAIALRRCGRALRWRRCAPVRLPALRSPRPSPVLRGVGSQHAETLGRRRGAPAPSPFCPSGSRGCAGRPPRRALPWTSCRAIRPPVRRGPCGSVRMATVLRRPCVAGARRPGCAMRAGMTAVFALTGSAAGTRRPAGCITVALKSPAARPDPPFFRR